MVMMMVMMAPGKRTSFVFRAKDNGETLTWQETKEKYHPPSPPPSSKIILTGDGCMHAWDPPLSHWTMRDELSGSSSGAHKPDQPAYNHTHCFDMH